MSRNTLSIARLNLMPLNTVRVELRSLDVSETIRMKRFNTVLIAISYISTGQQLLRLNPSDLNAQSAAANYN